jgi:2'-5' RNA ligase
MAAKNRRLMHGRIKHVYSLWLMPEGQIALRLHELIAKFSREYSTPRFEPHVTLIGELDMAEAALLTRVKDLASKTPPFDVRFNKVEYLDRYFQCVFIKAEKTRDLMKAHSCACAVFGLKKDQAYMPHLSLIYGHLTPQVKYSIVQAAGGSVDFQFCAEEIYLYYTGGMPADWHCVSSVALCPANH